MARLNDVPTTSDSIESLKRRFIRQNREIARANSVQSIRIRTLEAEVSHLLSENLTLQERIITANHELERYRSGAHIEDRISTLRARFELGLGELSALIKDLNSMPAQNCEVNAQTKRQVEEGPKRITPRSLLRLSGDDALLDDGGCLPAILEDEIYAPNETGWEENAIPPNKDAEIAPVTIEGGKLFEERSDFGMHSEEQNSSSSTNLPSKETCLSGPSQERNIVAHVLEKVRPINPRPKRRDSSLVQSLVSKRDVEQDHGYPDAPIVAATSSPIAGFKRKFEAQECESLPRGIAEDDEFQYTLLKNSKRPTPNDIGVGAENHVDAPLMGKQPPRSRIEAAKPRHALGPKNTNLNPKSLGRKGIDGGAIVERRKPSGRRKTESQKVSLQKTPEEVTNPWIDAPIRSDIIQLSLPVETKPDDQIASPVLAESTSQQSNFDSALPTEDELDGISGRQSQRSRPSRRSRGPVNYTEPSLRGKMRRPTEELVDAVAERSTQRLSRSHNDTTNELGNERLANAIDSHQALSQESQPDPFASNSHNQQQSTVGYNYLDDSEIEELPNTEPQSRSMRAPTPDPTARPVRQSRRHSSNPSHRADLNPLAHIPV